MISPKLLVTIVLASCCVSWPALGGGDDLKQLKLQFDIATKIIAQDRQLAGFGIGDSPEEIDALESEWVLSTEWLSASQSSQSSTDENRIKAALHNLDPHLDAQVLTLEPELYLIGLSRGEIGTVFSLRKFGIGFVSDWNIRRATAREVQHFPILAAWKAKASTEECRAKESDQAWMQCGPLYPMAMGQLPRDQKGRLRFYVDAGVAETAGGSIGYRLSIWTWDSNRAIPQFSKSYAQSIEISPKPRLQGSDLHVPAKNEFTNFFLCDGCDDPQTDLIIRIEPEGIRDLGNISEKPELGALDLLISRVANRRPTADLAARDVSAKIAAVVNEARDTLASFHDADKNYFSLGLLDEDGVESDPAAPGNVLLCFLTDSMSSPLLFTLVPRQKGYFFSKVRDLGGLDTSDKLCSK